MFIVIPRGGIRFSSGDLVITHMHVQMCSNIKNSVVKPSPP